MTLVLVFWVVTRERLPIRSGPWARKLLRGRVTGKIARNDVDGESSLGKQEGTRKANNFRKVSDR